MEMAICCLRVVLPRTQFASEPKISKPIFSVLSKRASPSSLVISSMPYEKELAAAKKAASLATHLCQKVQKALLQSDVHSKSDKSPVTVADYGTRNKKNDWLW
ncbi:SAL1 phosphatase [Quillaja saponaria]|uniref:SAL1 phosphatase n=1 Tax=Quillaja saponaria TaxID=32244 RepID=A0AAD7M5I7_QUISA|nr:SAL1 phosphatase [Quillaja saponaria]